MTAIHNTATSSVDIPATAAATATATATATADISSSRNAASASLPCILSLDELQVATTDEVYDYLAAPFRMAAAVAADENENDDDIDDIDDIDTTTPSANDSATTTTITTRRRGRSSSSKSLNRILQRMKIPPKTTILRVTRPYLGANKERHDVLEHVQGAMEEWISLQSLQSLQSSQSSSSSSSSSSSTQEQPQQKLSCHVKFHPIVSDVISIDLITSESAVVTREADTAASPSSLFSKRVPSPPRPRPRPLPLVHDEDDDNAENDDEEQPSQTLAVEQKSFSADNWPWRKWSGWPCSHAVVVVDRLCGEAVLRGADVFVKGILVADVVQIQKDQVVAVYADLGIQRKGATKTTRGQHLQHYTGHAVFLGLGTAACRRTHFFSRSHGLGVRMSALPWQRAGPVLPPLMSADVAATANSRNSSKTTTTTSLSQLLALGRVHAQNLPSALVAHVLDAQPGQVIFDMCAAPGGKTSHVAQLVRAATANAAANNRKKNVESSTSSKTTSARTIIVMADKSRKKVLQARELFQRLLGDQHDNGDDNCTITPLHLDSTNCVERRQNIPRQSVQEVGALLSCRVSLILTDDDTTQILLMSFFKSFHTPACMTDSVNYRA
jgi:16S rRNA methyltransferase RsmB/F